MANVISIAHVGKFESTKGAESFLESEEIGERLAGMKFVGERVDDRDGGVGGHFFKDLLFVDARNDTVDPAIEIAGDIGDGFAGAERGGGLRVVEENYRTAHALDADVEGDARAEGRLFENQGNKFARQRGSVTAGADFDFRGELEQVACVRGTPFGSGEQVIRQRNRRNK